MTALTINRAHLQAVNALLGLRYEPIALKMIEPGEDVPPDAYRPREHDGVHLALCQAFALSRRKKRTVYMQKADHWCWNPLMAYGHVKCECSADPGFDTICSVIGIKDEAAAQRFVASFPKLPLGRYEGILTAPLSRAGYEPDLWLIYCDNAQLRTILRAVKTQTGTLLRSEFDALDSCLYSVIPPLQNGEYRITLPDPGEYERALTTEDTIIFTVPAPKIAEFIAGAETLVRMGQDNASLQLEMQPDFARPPFYNEVFRAWGLDEGAEWTFPG